MVSSKTSVEMSSVDNTIAFLATLSAESMYRSLVDAPKKAFQRMSVEAQREAIGKYLARLAGIQGGTLEDLYNPSVLTAEHALALSEKLRSRLSSPSPAARNAVMLAGIDYRDTNRLKDIDHLASKIAQMDSIKGAQSVNEVIARRRRQLIGGGDSIINQMMAQIMNYGYGDLLLDVVRSNVELDYFKQVSREMEKVKAMLLEPYLTYGQHNIYGSSQGHYRLGVRGVSNSKQYSTALDMVNSGNVLASYAMASLSLAYGPTSPMRRYGLIRSVADKSTINFGVGEGLAFLDTPIQDVGDVSEMDIISSLGVGSVVKRHAIQSYMESISVPKERIDSLLNQAFGNKEDAERIVFTFDKPTQIPQRLKNALGARPMFDISMDA